MQRCLLIIQNPALVPSLRLWLAGNDRLEIEQISVRTVGKPPEPSEIVGEFHRLVDWIEPELEEGLNHQGVPDVVILTDLRGYGPITSDGLNPIAPQGSWGSVLGMLILAFPEAHWVFAAGKQLNAGAEPWSKLHCGTTPAELKEVLLVNKTNFCPLFDAGGIRDAVRLEMENENGLEFPRRKKLAMAIDEESGYAYLHAYTAYRFGYRAHAVTTFDGMRRFLNAQERNTESDQLPGNGLESAKPDLVFEDVFLNFGDQHPIGFSDLTKRDAEFPSLRDSRFRVFVTTGHQHGRGREIRDANRNYRKSIRDAEHWNCELYKPLAGIFNLWRVSKLQKKLVEGGRRGLAPGYVWPPSRQEGFIEHESGHSAPGRLLAVADRLIARAERLAQDEVSSVPQATYGAILATDALELLGGKTPTTSLEALTLKQQFEVLAECQFVGMEEHLEVRSRMNDIDREVTSLGQWFGPSRRAHKAACWNAELSILNRLIETFHRYNLFDEEQSLQDRARTLHRKLWFHKRPLMKIFEPAFWYIECLLASVQVFVLALAGWIVAFGFLYAWVGKLSISVGMASAFKSFLTWTPPDGLGIWEPRDGWNWAFCLVALAILSAFTHLGIFVAHLYSHITRK